MAEVPNKQPNQNQTFAVVVVAALLIFLFVHFGTNPSESDGKQVIAEKIRTQSEGRIALVSFAKTDGESREVLGAKIYVLHFEAKLRFVEDCEWGPVLGPKWQGEFRTVAPSSSAMWGHLGTGMDKRPAKAGSQIIVKGMILFKKTENGWQGDTGGEGTIEDAAR